MKYVFLSILLFPSFALATTPTQDEVFRSINQNVGSSVDTQKALPFLAIGALIIAGLIIHNHFRKRQVVHKALNNPRKLAREICRQIQLRPAEMRQLKLLAESQEITNPLTLLLCPSALGRAMRSGPAKADRKIVLQLVQRLREGFATVPPPAPAPQENEPQE